MIAFHVDLPVRLRALKARIRWTAGRIAAPPQEIQTRFAVRTIRLVAILFDSGEQIVNTISTTGTTAVIFSYPINRTVPVMARGSRKRKIVR